MSFGLFNTREQSRTADRDRAATIKASLSLLDFAEAAGLDPYPSRAGHCCDCPACRNVGKADIDPSSNTFKCRECGRSGDVISASQHLDGGSFRAACYRLELVIESRNCKQGGPGLFDAADAGRRIAREG